MWNSVFDSVRGTSHIEAGTPCQDCCRVAELIDNNSTYLVIVIADGAGSASHSEIGSSVACDEFLKAIDTAIKAGGVSPDATRDDAVNWCMQIRRSLEATALSMGAPVRQLACTLLGAIVADDYAIYLQIGDGAIVVSGEDQLEVVFWPQSGEYLNQTYFVTDDNFAGWLQFTCRQERVTSIGAFTDGLERLALSFDKHEVHGPFFATMLTTLRSQQDVEPLFSALRRFLESPSVIERTDDDKTLILATRRLGAEDDSTR